MIISIEHKKMRAQSNRWKGMKVTVNGWQRQGWNPGILAQMSLLQPFPLSSLQGSESYLSQTKPQHIKV